MDARLRTSRAKRIRRVIVQFVVVLVLGAITTIGITWGLAIRGTSYSFSPSSIGTKWCMFREDGERYLIFDQREDEFGITNISMWTNMLSPSDAIVTTPQGDFLKGPATSKTVGVESFDLIPIAWAKRGNVHPPNDAVTTRNETHFGWPMRALWGKGDIEALDGRPIVVGDPRGALTTRSSPVKGGFPFSRKPITLNMPISVPIGVLPVGLVCDIAFYGLLWWLILFARGTMRRLRRTLQNRCAACGYSRAGLDASAACPECGVQSESMPAN